MDERFYDFKVGTRWTFDAYLDGAKREVVFTVAAREYGRALVEHDMFNPPDPGATASLDEVWYLEDGYVLWGSMDGAQTTPWWRVFKVGSQEADTWAGPDGKGKAVNLGFTEVVVPAGRFPDALHIRLDDADGKTHDFYYAPVVGLVKWTTSGRRGSANLQLRSFALKGPPAT